MMEQHASSNPKHSAWSALSNVKHSYIIDDCLMKLCGGKLKKIVTVQHEVIGNIQQDCRNLLDKFIAQGQITFAAFSKLWRDIGFTFIFCGEPEHLYTNEFVEEVFGVAKAMWLPPKRILQREINVCQIPHSPVPSIDERLAAFYLIYALFKVQPTYKNVSAMGHMQFTILESDMKKFIEFVETIRERQLQELQFMLCTLITEEAFKFGATYYENPRKHLPYCEALEMQIHNRKFQCLTKNTVQRLTQLFCNVAEASSDYVRCKLRSPESCDEGQEMELLSSFVNFLKSVCPKVAEKVTLVPRDPDASLVPISVEPVSEGERPSVDPVISDDIQQAQNDNTQNNEKVSGKTRTSARLRNTNDAVAINNTVNVKDLEKKLENGVPYQCRAGKCTNKETCTHCYRAVQLPAIVPKSRESMSMKNYMDSSSSVFPIQHLMQIGEQVLSGQIKKKRVVNRKASKCGMYQTTEKSKASTFRQSAVALKKSREMSAPETELERRSGYCDSRFVLGYNCRKPSTATATSLPEKRSVRKFQKNKLNDLHALVAKVQKASAELSNIREIVEERNRKHSIMAQSKNRFDIYYNKIDKVAHLQFACSCCSPSRLTNLRNSEKLPKLADSFHMFYPDRIDTNFRDFEPYLQLFASLVNNPESLGELTLTIDGRHVPIKSLHEIVDSRCVAIGQLEACVLPLDVFEEVQKPCWNWSFTGVDVPFGRLRFRRVEPTASLFKSQEKCNKIQIQPQFTIKVLTTGDYLSPTPEQPIVNHPLPLKKRPRMETPPRVSPPMQPDSTSENQSIKRKELENVVYMKFPDIPTRKSVLARWGLGPSTDLLSKTAAIIAKGHATKQANEEKSQQYIRNSVLLGLERNIWPWNADENETSRNGSTQPPSKRQKLATDSVGEADSTSRQCFRHPITQEVRADYLADVATVYLANGTILIPYRSDGIR